MAKKKVQTEDNKNEVIEPVVETKESNKKVKSKDSKKDTKVEKVDAKTKDSKKETKNDNAKTKAKVKTNKDKKSLKKKASEVLSELKKVSKPSFGKVVKNTCVVIAVVAICTLLLFGVDRLFSLVNDLLLP